MPSGTWTDNEEIRLSAIEDGLTAIWKLLENVVNKDQFNRLNMIRQKEMANLADRITAVASDVADLQSDIEAL